MNEKLIALLLTLLLVGSTTTLVPSTLAQTTPGPGRLAESLEGEFDARDIAATSAWAGSLNETLNLADWLGPLAPVALSPFFGIALLSGLSLYGPDWVTNNALLGSSGPLQNPVLLVIFAGLALLTSLPRLTKVSKPFAQAVDRLETYAVIVILLVIKVVSSMESTAEPGTEIAMVQFGVFSVTADTLLAIAMVINVLVINSVKFFFEFLVWLTPVPFLDAVFEVCNKSLCAALMMVYAFSPFVATCINLVLLVVAALMLRWISRRVRFYRTMILDPMIARLWSGFGTPKKPELIVFPKAELGPFPAKSRLRLCRAADGDSWELHQANWWWPAKLHPVAGKSAKMNRGWVMHTIQIDEGELVTSRRFDSSLSELADQLAIIVADGEAEESPDLKAEFA